MWGVQLNLIYSEKHSEGLSDEPRNTEIRFSRGEYIWFIDSDDVIIDTALEELYNIAKKFNADVVHCEKYFQFNDGENKFILNGYQSGEFVKEPTLLKDNLSERVADVCKGRFLWNLWSKLIRRDFLFEIKLR